MIYGYIRVSTKGQAKDGNSLEFQEQELRTAGAEIVFKDIYTGTVKDRPELDKLMKTLKEGDMLVVSKLDRIARSVTHGVELIEELNSKGVIVNILNMGVIDNTPTGKLIRNVMLSFAEFERDLIVQRTQEGKRIARQNPDYREGRPKKYGKKQIDHALKLLENHSYSQVVEMTGISKATLAREKLRHKQSVKDSQR